MDGWVKGKSVKRYHLAWLKAHPNRSKEWLSKALVEGFDIHHMDGNHSNDEPDNLVLIESLDHFNLHGSPKLCRVNRFGHKWGERVKKRRIARKERKRIKPKEEVITIGNGEEAYSLRTLALTWEDIAIKVGFGINAGPKACEVARNYAGLNNWVWPIAR